MSSPSGAGGRPESEGAALLRQPVARAVRLVALSLLDDALTRAGRLRAAAAADPAAGDAPDPHDESLHDFRVAVRRLRSWLRAWEPWLADSVSRKSVRRVRRVARATGAARDIEVHLAGFHEQRRAMRGSQRAGLAWITGALASRWEEALARARDAAGELEAAQPKLSKQLSSYTMPVHPSARDEPFGVALAEMTRRQTETLRRRLAAVHAFGDEEAAHRARIAAKRLRYLLEPTAAGEGEMETEGSAILGRLKELQDLLGDLHDVHVLADQITDLSEAAAAEQARREAEAASGDDAAEARRARASDPGPGLRALAKRVHQRGVQAFARLERDWLGDAAAPFLERLAAHADRLAAGG